MELVTQKNLTTEDINGVDAILTKRPKIIRKLFFSVGYEKSDDEVFVIFQQGIKYPITHQKSFFTDFDNQTSLACSICQGERILFSKNCQIESLSINGIPIGPAQSQGVDFVFKIDENQIIHTLATIRNFSTLSEDFEINISRTSQYPSYSQNYIQNRSLFQNEDEKELQNKKAKGNLQRFIKSVQLKLENQIAIEKIISGKNLEQLQQDLSKIEQWVIENPNLTEDEYKSKFQFLSQKIPTGLKI